MKYFYFFLAAPPLLYFLFVGYSSLVESYYDWRIKRESKKLLKVVKELHEKMIGKVNE